MKIELPVSLYQNTEMKPIKQRDKPQTNTMRNNKSLKSGI